MATERVLTYEGRERRAFGWVITVFGLGLVGAWTWFAVDASRIGTAAIVLLAFFTAILALGVRLVFWPQDFLDVDLAARTYSLTRDGKPAGSGHLDELGPLEVKRRERVYRSNQRTSTIVRFAVSTRAHKDLDLYQRKTSGRARQKMERLARRWNLPARSLGGAVRPPDALDMPLHERLRDDAAARRPKRLIPESGVLVESLPQGYALRSIVRSYMPLAQGVVFLGLGVWGGYGPARSVPGMLEDEVGRVIVGVFALLALGLLWQVVKGVRDTFFPGTVRITERGVSYRGRRMRFGQIEEITATLPIEIVGDGRILKLGQTFCHAGYTDQVSHELQRMIIEVAERTPQPAYYSQRSA